MKDTKQGAEEICYTFCASDDEEAFFLFRLDSCCSLLEGRESAKGVKR